MTTFDKAKTTKKNHKSIIDFGKYYQKISDLKNNRMEWDKEKTIKILDKVFPNIVEWIEEKKAYYYSMEYFVSFIYKVPKKYRNYVKHFIFQIKRFMLEEYENENYIKTIEKDSYGTTWIKFIEK